jgi:hypothetical protein
MRCLILPNALALAAGMVIIFRGVQHRIVHQVLHHLPQAEQISLNEGRGLTFLPLRIPTLHYRAYAITTASHTRGGSRPSPLIVLLLTVKR